MILVLLRKQDLVFQSIILSLLVSGYKIFSSSHSSYHPQMRYNHIGEGIGKIQMLCCTSLLTLVGSFSLPLLRLTPLQYAISHAVQRAEADDSLCLAENLQALGTELQSGHLEKVKEEKFDHSLQSKQ